MNGKYVLVPMDMYIDKGILRTDGLFRKRKPTKVDFDATCRRLSAVVGRAIIRRPDASWWWWSAYSETAKSHQTNAASGIKSYRPFNQTTTGAGKGWTVPEAVVTRGKAPVVEADSVRLAAEMGHTIFKKTVVQVGFGHGVAAGKWDMTYLLRKKYKYVTEQLSRYTTKESITWQMNRQRQLITTPSTSRRG